MNSIGVSHFSAEMTSASGVLASGTFRHSILVGLLTAGIIGTSSAQPLPEKIYQRSPRVLQTNSGTPVSTDESAAADMSAAHSSASQIAELRRLSGLTWDQLASLFDVNRRSLHFWASGKPMTAENEERLSRILSAVKGIDRGSASANRAALLTDIGDGKIALDLLASSEYEKVAGYLGHSQGSRVIPPKLSNEVVQQRSQTLPVEVLMDAMQDPVHTDIGRGRVAKSVRVKSAA